MSRRERQVSSSLDEVVKATVEAGARQEQEQSRGRGCHRDFIPKLDVMLTGSQAGRQGRQAVTRLCMLLHLPSLLPLLLLLATT